MQKVPCKKKKYNSRFPPARIKKIMQSDDEVGKVAAVVPIIISRVLEIFVENLLKDSCKITRQRNARTLTPAHIKATILQNNQLDFLKEIVSLIPDIQTSGDEQLEHPSNYADYLSLASNNSNHHKLGHPIQRQFSHPSTSHHNPLRRATDLGLSTHIGTQAGGEQVGAGSLIVSQLTGQIAGVPMVNRVGPIPQHTITTRLTGELGARQQPAASGSSAFLTSGSRRFATYSRSNSAPCSTNDLLVSADELRNELKGKRKAKQREESMYEDLEEEDEEYELSSDENEQMSGEQASGEQTSVSADNGQSVSRSPQEKRSSELPCSSMVNLDNKLENCKVSKHRPELDEDDDYDA